MLKASEAIVLDENFGPTASDLEDNMPGLNKESSASPKRCIISLGPGPLWWS
ncbi:hypothetical protein BsWGS_28733 [Bradybaena similaris]